MESRRVREAQLWFSFMYWEPATAEYQSAVRTRAEVARLMGLSQITVARIEESAFRKLRANPEVKRLMRYVCQHNERAIGPCMEPDGMRKLGSAPGDASFMTL